MLVSTLMHREWYAWIGKRVSVNKDVGTLKYFGEIEAKSGFWCGIEFDEPIGVTDGTISGIQYFKCEANFGIFVPMHEVNRNSELTHCLGMKKPKVNVLCGAATKKPKSKMSLGSLNRTFDKNKNKPGTSCDTTTKVENSQADTKNINVRKRSKNSSHRVGTEESLGILSNLLEDDSSWDELATHEIKDDSVFSPPKTKGHLNLKPQLYQTQFDKQVPFNIKCASTPKPSFKSVMNLGATVKLDDLQFDHSFHDEIEPIIAGSNATKSMDFDLTNFKQSEVLCSTSKLTLPILPNKSPLLKEMPCIKNGELDFNKSFEDEDNVESRVSVNTFSNLQEVPKSSNVFNATYELIPEQLENCAAQSEQETSEILVLHPTAVNSNKKSTGVADLNATFILCSNSPSPTKEANKTFVLDHSPAKPLERSASDESEINLEKKSLSVIFENTMNESLSVNNAVEHIDKVQAISNPFPKLDGDENSMNLKISSKIMDKFDEISNSSVKIPDEKEIVSDLNSTFCITVEHVKSKNSDLDNINKKCRLSSISSKKNISTQQRKSAILDNKCIKYPQSISNQKTAFKIPAPYGATMKTKVIKNSTISILNKKDVKVRDKIVSEDTSKSFSNDNIETKVIEATSGVTEPQKGIVNSYKSVNRVTQQKENELHVTLKITDKNTQIVARRKSVGGVVTKVSSKISYGSNKKSISENSNVNLKVNKDTKNLNGFNTNLTNAKNGVVNRRHTMGPAFSSVGTQAKTGVAKRKSDLPSNARTDNRPLILKDKSLQSSTNQKNFGNKNECARDDLIKKPAQVETSKEDIQKDISSELDNKQNEKTIPRRELLRPGTLSRLPIAARSIKKPGFLATGVKPIKT